MDKVLIVFNAGLLAMVLTLAHVILKFAANNKSESTVQIYTHNPGKILIGLALFGFVFLVYPIFLKKYPVSIFFPIYTGLTLVFVAISGALIFGEKLAPIHTVGLILILVGIYCMAWQTK